MDIIDKYDELVDPMPEDIEVEMMGVDWEAWTKDPLTQLFMKHIFYRKIERQKIILSQKHDQGTREALLGGYWALLETVDIFNDLKRRNKCQKQK